MGIVIIVAIVGLFMWWSLVPVKPKNDTLDSIINDAQKRQGKYSRVYQSYQMKRIFYVAKEPIDPLDEHVYSGTENDCYTFVSKRTQNFS